MGSQSDMWKRSFTTPDLPRLEMKAGTLAVKWKSQNILILVIAIILPLELSAYTDEDI